MICPRTDYCNLIKISEEPCIDFYECKTFLYFFPDAEDYLGVGGTDLGVAKRLFGNLEKEVE